MKVLITSPAFCQPSLRDLVDDVERVADEVILNPYGRTFTKEEVLELWDGTDAIIAGHEPYTREVLELAPETLKVISRYGVGYSTIDTKAAGERGIRVTNTPGANTDAVADMTLGLMISVARHIPQCDHRTRSGDWKRYIGAGLSGKTIGIVGLGAIGKAVARRCTGFSMDIISYDPFFDASFGDEFAIRRVEMVELLRTADFISLHVPFLPDTERMINKTTLGAMKNSAILINVSRGQLVDEDALYSALESGEIVGAGLDVFSVEPMLNSRLFELENVVVTPHIAGFTHRSEREMGVRSVSNAMGILDATGSEYVVNLDHLA